MPRRPRPVLPPFDGVATRQQLLTVIRRDQLDRAASAGQLRRVLPHVYAPRYSGFDERTLRLQAALAYVDGCGALSHVTALHLWGLPASTQEQVHVVVPTTMQRTSTPVLRVHRRTGFDLGRDRTVREGLFITRLETTIIDSWPLLRGDEARAPSIVAVRDGRTTSSRLLAEARNRPNLKGRAALLGLLQLLHEGCRSELELFGHLHVFRRPGLSDGVAQFRVSLGGTVAYLDYAFPAERVGVELDGMTYHGSPAQRERDMRRDALLAAAGWLIVRFSGSRLRNDPEGVHRELVAILAQRRTQLGLSR